MSQCIEANPGIAGVGVRAATYAQNFFALLVAASTLTDGDITRLEERTVAAQTTGILLTASSLLFSAFIQAQTLGLSTYHAIIILNLAWMNTTNTLMQFPLFFLDQVNRRSAKMRQRKWKTMLRSPPFLIGSIHLSILSGFGWWFWWKLDTFGARVQIECPPDLSLPLRILGYTPLTSNHRLRIASLVIYTPFLIPFINVILLDHLIAFLIMLIHLLLWLVQIAPQDIERTYSFLYLFILAGVDITFAIDTESTIIRASPYVKSGESQWTYGQTLACFLLAIPVVELFRASAELLHMDHPGEGTSRCRKYNGHKGGRRAENEGEKDSFGGLPRLLQPLLLFFSSRDTGHPGSPTTTNFESNVSVPRRTSS